MNHQTYIFLLFLPFSTYILSDSIHFFSHVYIYIYIYIYIVFTSLYIVYFYVSIYYSYIYLYMYMKKIEKQCIPNVMNLFMMVNSTLNILVLLNLHRWRGKNCCSNYEGCFHLNNCRRKSIYIDGLITLQSVFFFENYIWLAYAIMFITCRIS